MAIMRWDPFGEVLRMQRDMERIFDRMGEGEGSRGQGQGGGMAWMPKINVKQSGDDVAVHVELAGIKPEDVDIEVTNGVLTIRGERKADQEREDEGWLIRESSYGSFERSMVLPEGVEADQIKADFHDGMLEVRVPKALEAARPRTTKIAIGGVGGSEEQRELQGGQQQGQQGQQGQQQREETREPAMAGMGQREGGS